MFDFFKKKPTPPTPDNSALLEKYQDKINDSIIPFIEIKAHEAENLKLWQSKFAGQPYLPIDTPYPKTSKGKHLHLLAQINFDDVPNLAPYPETGILQFWIHDSDHYGLNFDDQTIQDTFRVTYYPTVRESDLVTDFSFVSKPQMSPIMNENAQYGLTFKKLEMPVSVTDYKFEEIFPDPEDELYDLFDEKFSFEGHRIGGYGGFTQTDPREYTPSFNILLFQLDTDEKNDFMWGDSGIGNFFISKEHLENRDFSKILYNWDCF